MEAEEKEISQEDAASVLYGTPKAEEAEPEIEDEAVEEAPEEPEETEKEEQPDQQSRRKKKEFIFDKQKYIDQGVTDEKSLSLLEERDREIHLKKVTIGRQGTENKEAKDQLEKIQKQLDDLKGKAKDLTDDEYDELYMESPAKARKYSEEAKKAKEEEARLMREQVMIQNQAILDNTATDDMEALNVDEIIPDVQAIIKKDISRLGGDDDQASQLISNFKKDPLGALDTGIFYNVVERVQLQYELEEYKTQNQKLTEAISKLKEEIKTKPQETVKRINKVSNSAHAVNSIPGGYSSESEPRKLSPADAIYG